MKKIFFIFILSMVAKIGIGQEKWTIKLNNKIILTATKEDTAANTKRISRIEWRKSGYLEVNYKGSESSALKESFSFNDENDKELLYKDSVAAAKISTSILRKIFAGKKKIIIYCIFSPRNPMMAIRSRRILLCTLLLP